MALRFGILLSQLAYPMQRQVIHHEETRSLDRQAASKFLWEAGKCVLVCWCDDEVWKCVLESVFVTYFYTVFEIFGVTR